MIKLMTTLLLLLTAAFCIAGGGTHEKLPPKQFADKMDAEAGVVLDVRTPEEYGQGHLKGAENLNFYDADFAERLKARDKEKTYYVYCRSGGRSGKTLAMMKEAGFVKVYDMVGGMTAWQAAELPVEH